MVILRFISGKKWSVFLHNFFLQHTIKVLPQYIIWLACDRFLTNWNVSNYKLAFILSTCDLASAFRKWWTDNRIESHTCNNILSWKACISQKKQQQHICLNHIGQINRVLFILRWTIQRDFCIKEKAGREVDPRDLWLG